MGLRSRLRTRLRIAPGGGGGGATLFDAPLTASLVPVSAPGSPTPTFTRATTAYFSDLDGTLREAGSSAPRFHGARQVQNLIASSQNFAAGWAGFNGGVIVATSRADPFGGNTAMEVTLAGVNAQAYCACTTFPTNSTTIMFSCWVKAVSAATSVRFKRASNTDFYSADIPVTTAWTRICMSVVLEVGSGVSNVAIANNAANTTTPIYVAFFQVEPNAATPGEYVSRGALSAPYHGAGVDGVKYFATLNGNTVAGSVVTEATGAAIPDTTLLGYVAEGQRTNLFVESGSFSGWANEYSTSAAGTLVTPGGTISGVVVTATGTNSAFMRKDVAGLGAVTLTMSVFAKAGTHDQLMLDMSDSITGDASCNFNLTTRAFSAANAGGWTGAAGSITAFSNGWFRCTLTATKANTGTVIGYLGSSSSGGAAGKTINLWGAQLEAAVFASTYIPTTSASVTRNADVLTYARAGNIGNVNATVYCEARTATVAGQYISFVSSYSSVGEQLGLSGATNKLSIYDATSTVPISSAAITRPITTPYKLASAWNATVSGAVNGAVLSAAYAGSIVATTSFAIGDNLTQSGNIYGTIRNVRIYPTALSDALLAEMTTPPVTWNPADKDPDITLSNGNLSAQAPGSSATAGSVRATLSRNTGKYYFEGKIDLKFNTINSPELGLCGPGFNMNAAGLDQTSPVWGMVVGASDDYAYANPGLGYTAVGRYVTNDIIGVAVDITAGKAWIARNGVWLASGDPAAGTGSVLTFTGGTVLFPVCYCKGNAATPPKLTARFAAADFTYAPPTGFLPWGP